MNTQSNLFTRERVDEDASFSAPLGALKKGQLEMVNGVSNIELTGDPSIRELFQGQFSGLVPEVRTRNERVIIRHRLSITGWLEHVLSGYRHAGKILLNTSIPWQIELRGGVSHLDADLREIQLRSLIVTGGVSEADILLPRPVGTVQIHVASGVSNLRIFHPQGVAAQLKVGGGINQLVFHGQSYGSIGGGIQVDTADYKTDTNRYEIVIDGGVSNLSVRTQA